MPNEAPTVSTESLRPCTFEGFMTKEGSNVKSWKKRWFILKDNLLYYFKNSASLCPKGCLLLTKTSSVVDKAEEVTKLRKKTSLLSFKTMPIMFAIVTDTHTLFTSVDTPQDKDNWAEALRNTISTLKGEPILKRPSFENESSYQQPLPSIPPQKPNDFSSPPSSRPPPRPDSYPQPPVSSLPPRPDDYPHTLPPQRPDDYPHTLPPQRPNDYNFHAQNQLSPHVQKKPKLPVGAVNPFEPKSYAGSRLTQVISPKQAQLQHAPLSRTQSQSSLESQPQPQAQFQPQPQTQFQPQPVIPPKPRNLPDSSSSSHGPAIVPPKKPQSLSVQSPTQSFTQSQEQPQFQPLNLSQPQSLPFSRPQNEISPIPPLKPLPLPEPNVEFKPLPPVEPNIEFQPLPPVEPNISFNPLPPVEPNIEFVPSSEMVSSSLEYE